MGKRGHWEDVFEQRAETRPGLAWASQEMTEALYPYTLELIKERSVRPYRLAPGLWAF